MVRLIEALASFLKLLLDLVLERLQFLLVLCRQCAFVDLVSVVPHLEHEVPSFVD